MIVFATVGTTSFDSLVSSLCTLPSLNTIAREANHHHHRQKTPSPSKHSHSSSPLVSEQLSTSTLPVEIPLEQSCSTSACSYSSSPPSSFGPGDVLNNEDVEAETLELVIQYGQGTCPLSLIPPSLKRTSVECDVHENDDNGSITLMVPTNNTDGTQQNRKMLVKWYRFQPSLLQDMERADIILCHAGAGTLLEALAIRREQPLQPPIINAVINRSLMNNHQSELAEELERRKHITVTYDCTSEWTTEEEANKFWSKLRAFQPVPWNSARRNPNKYKSSFQRIVDGVMSVEDGHM